MCEHSESKLNQTIMAKTLPSETRKLLMPIQDAVRVPFRLIIHSSLKLSSDFPGYLHLFLYTIRKITAHAQMT